ncbi:hypothetical protein [Corallococcus sp. AB038B]|uniref:hypothetical protein n=1 Tax=Corallococcus sp. AB038B TaxID=2316718 RepID=UPI000EC7D474|nr:hypothetical protein [Corallococcus sp. AB038B]RKI04582.1 hypothetical protein D7Y04_06580 [Corallococcus sp. AB038B]
MKKILFGLAAMASLTLTACGGGDYCDRNEDLADDLASKAEECGVTGTDKPTDEEVEAATKACKTALDSCSDADKDLLDSALDCVEKVESCSDKSEAQQTSFFLALATCYSKASGVSAACQAAISAE